MPFSKWLKNGSIDMGRLSELFEFLNAEDIPGAHEMQVKYTHISKTPELKALRLAYRKVLRRERVEAEKKLDKQWALW